MKIIHHNQELTTSEDAEVSKPCQEPLTVEKLRTFEGFEEVTEGEALEIIRTIDIYCRITVQYMMEQNLIPNEQENLAA